MIQLDAKAVARALGGEASGNTVSAPGPGHSPKDRSLTVTIDPAAPGGFVVFSHAGDDRSKMQGLRPRACPHRAI